VCTHDGTVHDGGDIFFWYRQGFKNIAPGSLGGPIVKAIVDGLPFTVPLWQISPPGTRASYPKYTV